MAPPTVDTSRERRLWLLLIVDLAFAATLATEYVAWRLDFYPRALGLPAFIASEPQRVSLYTIAVSLAIATATALLLRRQRRFIPAGFLVVVGCLFAAQWPVYAPWDVIKWAYVFRRYVALKSVFAQAAMVFTGTAVAAIGATFGSLRSAGRREATGSYGTARWGDARELVRDDGLLIGRDGRNKPLRYVGDGHLLTVAPTRSGKGVGVVIPNILTYPGPIVVTDPKGENYAVTGARRRVIGGPVHALDPFNIAGGRAAYNPLDLIDADGDTTFDDAGLLAEMLVVGSGRGGDSVFWDTEAKAILSGLILHVVAHETRPQRTLARVRTLLSSPPDQFAGLVKEMSTSDAVGGLVARAANRILSTDPRLRSNIISAAQSHMHFLDSTPIARVTGSSTIALPALVEECASIFLILPPAHMQTHRAWLRVMIACALRCAMGQGQRTAHRTLFLLDEFANLGPMEPIQSGISIAGGYGVTFWLLVQDLAQLRHVYGETAQSFIANSDVLQAFGVNDLETAEHLSKLAGDQTVVVVSQSRSSGVSRGRGGSSQEGAAETVSEHSRRLITADEVRRLPAWEQLLFLRGQAPLKVQRIDYRVDREFAGMAAPNPLYCVSVNEKIPR